MTVAYDNSAQAFSQAGVSSLTTPSFAIAGSNRIVLAAVLSGAGTPANPSAVKWGGSGGTSLTQVGSTLDVGSFLKLSLWRLIAPTVQTSTGYVSWGSAQDETGIIFASYTGVDQTTPLGTAATANTGFGNNSNVNVTAVVGDLVVSMMGWTGSGNDGIASAAGGATARQVIDGTDLHFEALGWSELVAASTTQNMSWDSGGANEDNWGIIGVALKAVGGSGSPLLSQIECPAHRGMFRGMR